MGMRTRIHTRLYPTHNPWGVSEPVIFPRQTTHSTRCFIRKTSIGLFCTTDLKWCTVMQIWCKLYKMEIMVQMVQNATLAEKHLENGASLSWHYEPFWNYEQQIVHKFSLILHNSLKLQSHNISKSLKSCYWMYVGQKKKVLSGYTLYIPNDNN